MRTLIVSVDVIWLAAHWIPQATHDSYPGAQRRMAAIHLPCTVRVVGHVVAEGSSTEKVHHTLADHQAAATAGERRMGFAKHAMSRAMAGLRPESRSIRPVVS
jgi:hypothetical protein